MCASSKPETARPFIAPVRSSLTSSNTLGSLKWVVAFTIALARFSASTGSAKVVESFMKMPLPTNTASAPSCITKDASARGPIPPAGEIWDGKLPCFGDDADQLVRGLMLFGFGVKFFFAEDGENFHLLDDLADVLDGVDYVAGAGFAFGADHAGAFRNAAESFAQIAGAADEGDLESVLVDVVSFVGGGEHFGFVDVVDAEFLENLGFGKVADAALGHDWNGDGLHDLANLFGRSHAGYAALGADLRGDAFERHDGDGTGIFGDGGLLGVGDVHDDAAFEHFGKAGLEAETGGTTVVFRHGGLRKAAYSSQLSAIS